MPLLDQETMEPAGTDPPAVAAMMMLLGLSCRPSQPRNSSSTALEFLPGASYQSVGVCLPGGLWAEISNFADIATRAVQPDRRVAIRRRERCAAAMTASRAFKDTVWLERDCIFDVCDGSTGELWEDYAYASKLTDARQFVTLAFEISPGPSDPLWILDAPWERRIFTITVGGASLDTTVPERVRELGNALVPVLAPHFPDLLASLDLFISWGLPSAPSPPACCRSGSPRPGPPPGPSASGVHAHPPAHEGPTGESRDGAHCLPTPMSTASTAMPSPPTGDGHPEMPSEGRGVPGMSGNNQARAHAGSLPVGFESGPTADISLPETKSHLCEGGKHDGDLAVQKISGTSLQGRKCNVDVEGDEDAGKVFQGKMRARLALDVSQHPFLLTFRDARIEGLFQKRTAAKRVQGDLHCMTMLVILWAVAALTESLADGEGILARQPWYRAFAVFFCSVLVIIASQPSWYANHRQAIAVLVKYTLRMAGCLYMRNIRILDPEGLPGAILKHGVVIPIVYLIDGICMPMSFRSFLLYLIPAAALAMDATWQGCSLGCSVLSPARCRNLFTATGIALGEIIPLWHIHAMEQKERAAFAAAALLQA